MFPTVSTKYSYAGSADLGRVIQPGESYCEWPAGHAVAHAPFSHGSSLRVRCSYRI